ncbi:hypothetical protein [Guggenheimella bovis]
MEPKNLSPLKIILLVIIGLAILSFVLNIVTSLLPVIIVVGVALILLGTLGRK